MSDPTRRTAEEPPPRRRSVRRRVTLGSTAAALVCGLLVSACGTDSGSDAESGQSSGAQSGCTTTSTSGQRDANLIPIPPAAVTVTSTGNQPQRVVGGAPDRSTPQHSTLSTTSSVTAADGTTEQTVDIPITATFHCTDNTDLEMTLGASTSPDPTLNDQLKAARDAKAGVALGPGAAPVSLRLIPTKDSGSEARSAIEQSLVQAFQNSIPLPTEPIGVGATWRTERTITAATTLTQTITATLKAWDGNRVTIDFTTEESPVNSVYAIPGSDTTLTISRYSYTGSGTLVSDVTRGLPLSGSGTYTGARELVGADPANPLLQKIGFSYTWK
ncbi:hypothetical protein [Gordonia jacobaea]|uniref:hypothetical protein n=1 Tax=Gordonia jacobaea TaxID=122202 RepID=UPI003D702FD4